MKKSSKIIITILIILIVLIVSFVGYIYYILSSVNPPAEEDSENYVPPKEMDWSKKINILLIGIDQRYEDENSRSDTNLLLSIDPNDKKITIVSLPRDTFCELPGYVGYQKLAHAHYYGGVPLLIKTVENILEIEIPFYVEVNFEGFVKMIDLIGGVTIDVEKDMNYESRSGDVKIHLKKGLQHLNGEKALMYVRFRMDETGDVGRMERQQKFLKALIEQSLKIENTIRLQKVLIELKNWVKTNLEPWQIIKLGLLFNNIDNCEITTMTLPGYPDIYSDGLSYYFLYNDKVEEIVNTYLKDE
ncbi:MAG TPA: LCP family protein [Caldisericia bacterium]|mgnify:CR=1 FL=1|nr:LCP family protein [Caldisericia bacterium]HOL82520.1 LCP family protein [Caldisericia bacterium]HON82864.1 LCP family protein [Caldisericia bacterium]HPC56315.1 LCP family protein [Caldisericia bacterium]HPP43106.1 LCP family protein [Caldisericia bacterium]